MNTALSFNPAWKHFEPLVNNSAVTEAAPFILFIVFSAAIKSKRTLIWVHLERLLLILVFYAQKHGRYEYFKAAIYASLTPLYIVIYNNETEKKEDK